MPAPIDHERLLNFRLWKLASLASAPVIRLCEGVYGISRRDWLFIALLARDGALAPSELSLRGNIDRARTSRAVSSLVSKGLAQRESLPGVERRARVSLTETGRRLAAEIHPQIAAINDRVMAALDAQGKQALEDAIQRLTDQAARVNQEVLADVRANRRLGGSGRRRPDEGQR